MDKDFWAEVDRLTGRVAGIWQHGEWPVAWRVGCCVWHEGRGVIVRNF